MKNLLFTSVCLLFSLESMAQNSLSGSVKDKNTGEILIGAIIHIADINRSAATDSNGTYNF